MMQYISGWKTVERHPGGPNGSLGVAGEAAVFTWKVPPRPEEKDGYFKTRGLPAQAQAIMGFGLVGQRGDSGRMVL